MIPTLGTVTKYHKFPSFEISSLFFKKCIANKYATVNSND